MGTVQEQDMALVQHVLHSDIQGISQHGSQQLRQLEIYGINCEWKTVFLPVKQLVRHAKKG